MQEVIQLQTNSLRARENQAATVPVSFLAALLLCIVASAAFASWLPLQVSIITLFLFAGPHNWFELRYFLMRLPVRFGKSRKFFLTAFAGLGLLTTSYVLLPLINRKAYWSNESWLTLLAIWNTLFLCWLCVLVLLRGRQKTHTNWTWSIPATFALCSLNWLQPDLFSLGLVYVHPLVALWFLDRHLMRSRPSWSRAYRCCLVLLPVVLGLMIWQLSPTTPLPEDNGLFWRITQHSGAELLPNVSSHLLVSVHLFLEMLHYGVWIVALPLIGAAFRKARTSTLRVWDPTTVPLFKHPRGFPKVVVALLGTGAVMVMLLWVGFSIDYATTRDIYFTVAIAHVMAEAPFLLRMI